MSTGVKELLGYKCQLVSKNYWTTSGVWWRHTWALLVRREKGQRVSNRAGSTTGEWYGGGDVM